jgi:hypothetical protein
MINIIKILFCHMVAFALTVGVILLVIPPIEQHLDQATAMVVGFIIALPFIILAQKVWPHWVN